MERSIHAWDVGFCHGWDDSDDDPFMQAVGGAPHACDGRVSLT